MNLKRLIIQFIVLIQALCPADAQVSKVWIADQGNGFYKNPVLHADYSDPDAIRVGTDYYMTSSSFNCMPGLPILHSKDLVNWTIVNHALPSLEPDREYRTPQHGKGVWAPAIRFHHGEYLIYYPDPDHGIYMIKAKHPTGYWSKPVLVLSAKGAIDPCPYWDNDGKAYLAVGWAGSRAGVNSLLTIFEMNAPGTRTTSSGRHVFDGHGKNHTVEGPKIYKRNHYYYILAPAGGVATGWQLALRSRSIYGPYESKVVMDQGATKINGPHQGALLDTPYGEYWFLHFQDKGPYGRLVHLQPVSWKNDWPVIGRDSDGDGTGEPVLSYKKPATGKSYPLSSPPENDEFNTNKLGQQWQWHANPQVQWSALLPGAGYLRLFCFPQVGGIQNLWNTPNLLLQKFPASTFTATTKMKLEIEWDVWQGKTAGLIITGNDYAYLAIAKNERGYQVRQIICKDAFAASQEQIVEQRPLSSGVAYLRVKVTGPDATCVFCFSEDGKEYHVIGQPFKAQPDKWIGSKVGLFSVSQPDVRLGGYADVDWFRIE